MPEQCGSGAEGQRQCGHLVAGDFDYFLKVRVKYMADFNKLHGEQLIAFPGVRQIRSFFVMKEVTDNAELNFQR